MRDLRKGGHQIVPAGKPSGEVDGWRLLETPRTMGQTRADAPSLRGSCA